MRISVFCSVNEHINPVFFEQTAALGRWMGLNGHTLVYGGCDMGLMECVARAVHENGGQVVGVVPSILEKGGHASKYIDTLIGCETLDERKQLMLTHSDVALALPGGIGTLDEIFSMASQATLGYHAKQVVVYDMVQFWQPLESMLNHLQQQGLMRGDYHRLITFAHSLDEVRASIAHLEP